MDTLKNNAVQSIQIGVEDFESDDPRRVLSAVRNITAGVLLLFKEKLRELSEKDSNEVLLKQKIKPILRDGIVEFVGSGGKTVDVHHIEERLRSLKVDVDWQRVHKIIQVRNNVEHYYLTDNEMHVKELISESFIVIQNFIKTALKEEPIDLLGKDTWTTLLDTAEVYKKEKEACKKEMAKVDWKSYILKEVMDRLRCTTCQSELIKPSGIDHENPAFSSFSCMSCNDEFFASEEAISELVNKRLGSEIYSSLKESEDSPVTNCQDCGQETFILRDENKCLLCQSEAYYYDCLYCSGRLSPDEQFLEGVCGSCQHGYDKMMAE